LDTVFKGRVWKFGDNVDTDLIIAGKYLTDLDPDELAKVVFEGLNPDFAKQVGEGDIIVAGSNFGCGSSREHAPSAIKCAGIKVIVAESFARIFFRNAINIGLTAIECPDIADNVGEGEVIEVDIKKGVINLPTGKSFKFNPIPDNVLRILELGGLVNKVKEDLGLSTR